MSHVCFQLLNTYYNAICYNSEVKKQMAANTELWIFFKL